MRTDVWSLTLAATLCFAVVALLSCRGEPPSADRSLLTGEPCEPPCWQGLTPGQSTTEDVADFLESSDLVDQSTLWRDGSGCGVITRWRSPIRYRRGRPLSWDQSNWLCTGDGLLKEMEILLDYELTLEQLLPRYGPPDKFDAVDAGPPERPYVAASLYYPERGMMLQLELPITRVELRRDTKVIRVWYMPPTTLEGMARAMGVPHPGDFVRRLQDWQGYGQTRIREVTDS